MSFRKSHLLGLLALASMAMPPSAQGADNSQVKWLAGAPATANSSSDDVAELARQSAAKAQQATGDSQSVNAAPAWKRVDDVPSVDIRFKKPATAATTDQPARSAAPAEKPAAPPQAQPPIAAQPQQAASPPVQQAIATAPPAAPAVATQAAATTPVIAPLPAVTPPLQAAAPHTDDQIQLVARRLMDSEVRHAAQDEPLPSAPDTDRSLNHRDNSSGNDNGSNGSHKANPYDDGACCDQGCCDCCPQPCLFWVGGVEATFLNPNINNDGVSFEVEEIAHDRDQVCSSLSDDVDSLYMAPRIWFGVQGCCWGADIRYWHLRACEDSFDPSVNVQGNFSGKGCGQPDFGFFSSTCLDAYTLDLELTRRFCINDCAMQGSFGVRHAEFELNEGVTGLASTDDGLLEGFARANRFSQGTGILLGLYGRRPVFPCSCVNWFYNVHWSALWGPSETAAETFASIQASDNNAVATAGSVNGAHTHVDDTMYIGEVQLGLEWDYKLCCLPANAFFRAAVEYQRWDMGKGSSQSESFAGVTVNNDFTSVATTTASALAPEMDLFGFSIGTGLTW